MRRCNRRRAPRQGAVLAEKQRTTKKPSAAQRLAEGEKEAVNGTGPSDDYFAKTNFATWDLARAAAFL
jgi:hypothetical protein